MRVITLSDEGDNTLREILHKKFSKNPKHKGESVKTLLLIAVSLCVSFPLSAFAADKDQVPSDAPKAVSSPAQPPALAGIAVLIVRLVGMGVVDANKLGNRVMDKMNNAGIKVGMVDTASCEDYPKCVVSLGSALGVATVVAIQINEQRKLSADSYNYNGRIEVISTSNGKRLVEHDFTALKENLKSGILVSGLDEFIKKVKDALQPVAVASPSPEKVLSDKPKVSEAKPEEKAKIPADKPVLREVYVEPARTTVATSAEAIDKDPSKKEAPGNLLTVTGISVGGAGLVGLGVGVFFNTQAWSKYNSAKAANGVDPTKFESDKRVGIEYSRNANVFYVIGGIAAATGAALIVIDVVRHSDPSNPVSAPVSVVLTGNGIGLTGKF